MGTKDIKRTILLFSVDKKLFQDIDTQVCLKEYHILKAQSHSEVLSLFESHRIDIIFFDIEKMPTQEMDLVHYIKTRSPNSEIIILTTMNELENATYSLHNGASFYLMKPVKCSEMQFIIEKVSARIDQSVAYSEHEHRFLMDLMSGSQAMEKMLKLAIKIAPTASTILVGGESGTGKEFFAKIIHRTSKRTEGKFVTINCGAVPDTLFESELFGHKKGSFTGADRDKAGLVEEAHMGTLFLDEVGELSPQAQVKLLRFLQERSFRRVGETITRTVNVRVIAATNKNLWQMIHEGSFREDLFYRLNVFYLHLPPLRERKETIPNLVRLFVHKNNVALNKNINSISKAAEVILAEYSYPGNVRELENIIEHAVVMAESSEISVYDLPEHMRKNRLLLAPPHSSGSQFPAITDQTSRQEIGEAVLPLEEMEKQYIARALTIFENNYTETAQKLGISRSTLWRKMKSYGLDKG